MLYSILDGEMEIADCIITFIANNYHSKASYYETARLFKLYTEIFCDRGAFSVVGNTAPVINSMVKLPAGLENVHAESYIKLADKILSEMALIHK